MKTYINNELVVTTEVNKNILRDLKEINDYPTMLNKTYKVGDRFKHDKGVKPKETGTYMIVGACKGKTSGPCFIIDLKYGWSYTGEAIYVNDCHNITQEEFNKMVGSRPESFKQVNSIK